MKLGITLSGGGVRATVFHLGFLTRLAEAGLWDDLVHISTVSGGSLCAALIFEKGSKKWPTKEAFFTECLPPIFKTLTTFNLQRAYLLDIFIKPWRLFQGRAHLIGMLIKKHWGVTSSVSEMPMQPRWTINSTCYETGKNWRFSAKRMGGHLAHYVPSPDYPLSDAVASSAAVPGLIGPLKIRTEKYRWKEFKGQDLVDINAIGKSITLWDGGVYDNLGVEALYKTGIGLRSDIDFLLVSDASKPLEVVEKKWIHNFPLPKSPKHFRLVDISTDQVRSLRARDLFSFFLKNKSGGYLRIGESVKKIFQNLKIPLETIDPDRCLNNKDVFAAASFDTTLRKLSVEEFRLLFRHGYETCSAVLHCKRMTSFIHYDAEKFSWLLSNEKKRGIKCQTLQKM